MLRANRMDSYQRGLENAADNERDPDCCDSISDTHSSDGGLTDESHSNADPSDDSLNTLDDSGLKRKLAASPPLSEPPNSKRARLDGPVDRGAIQSVQHAHRDMVSRLPVEAWHRIFTFVPPRTLGNLLMVNKEFNSCLDPSSIFSSSALPTSTTTGVLPRLKPDAIWQASRRLFWPRMPAAMEGRSELDMWRLCCSRACQFCKFRGQAVAGNLQNQWKRGPGAKGVSPIFPFFIASCGRCLGEKSVKEIDILLSSSLPSALLPGLPMVFLTRENHVVSPHVLCSADPFHEQVTKVFWVDQVEKIKGAFEDTKTFGPAAAEEWIKGLESHGKRSLADAARWERWYLVGGVHDMRKLIRGPFPHTDSNSQDSSTSISPDFGDPVTTANRLSHVKHKERVLNRERFVVDPRIGVISVVQDQPGLHVDSAVAISTDHANSSSSPLRLMTEQTDTLKALRRAEIERRAYALRPPIPPSVLARLPAFLAAIQITTPLDDDAWQLLKRRLLLEQQNEGLRLDRESRADFQPFVEVVTRQDDDGARVNGAVTDADWNEVQGPVRAQISAFADEIIKQEWKGGQKVTKKNAPHFAADVLLYVRKKFYTKIAKDIEEAKASGESLTTEPSEGPWTRKLTIENMKWIFDCKVKPHTGNLRRELFLCSSCKGSLKFYVFEGVVQHYAAKHTNALSSGNTIVYWRAEWPKKPIFEPDLQKRLHPHSKSKSKTLDDYFSPTSGSTPASDHGEQAATQPSPECGNHAPTAEMGVSTQYGPNGLPGISQHESCPRPGHLYGRSGYPPHSRFPHYEQPPPRVEPYSETSYNVLGTSQITGYGPSVLSPEEEAGARAEDRKSRQLEQTLATAKQTWQSIMNVKSLENSVRVCAVIHHTAMSFQERFREALPLGLFLEAITNSAKHALRLDHVAGLACKACKLGAHPALQSKTYSLAKLLKHFNANHSENAAPPVAKPLDWRVDMIWLPEISTLMTLRERIGNNKDAFNVIFNTLPWAFETPNRPGACFAHDLTQVSSPQWQQPSMVANEVPIRSNEPSPPRLDRDGFEFLDQLSTPAAHSRRQDESGTDSQFRIPQTAHDRISYNLSYQEPTATPLPNYATNARSTTHSGHDYSNSQYHPHHPRENRAVESYEIVEVHDPNGDYIIRRPRLVRHEPQRGIHEYENHSHPYAARYPNGGRYMNKNSRLDHEEYDPRFPAVGGASYTR